VLSLSKYLAPKNREGHWKVLPGRHPG